METITLTEEYWYALIWEKEGADEYKTTLRRDARVFELKAVISDRGHENLETCKGCDSAFRQGGRKIQSPISCLGRWSIEGANCTGAKRRPKYKLNELLAGEEPTPSTRNSTKCQLDLF